MKKAIVLAANYQYSEQIMTTIKSIFCHNRNIKIYLINNDIPSEWFKSVNSRLSVFDSEIIDAKAFESAVNGFKTDISYTVFFRYFVSDFVQEDRVLYLDCDIVVKSDLTPLFELDMQGYPVGAVRDQGGWVYFTYDIFNAGVLLIDNCYWKEHSIKDKLIELTNELHETVEMADQSILNILFKDNWLRLPATYNFIPNHASFSDETKDENYLPTIVHYLTHRKPWDKFTKQLYRKDWWLYNQLDWSEVVFINQKQVRFNHLDREKTRPICLIYTNSGDIEHVDTLITSLPHVDFIVASQVAVGDSIARLLVYKNVEVYSGLNTLYWIDEYIIDRADICLDINYGDEVCDIISKFNEQGKPCLAFENTKHGEQGQIVFSKDEPEKMIATINEFINGVG